MVSRLVGSRITTFFGLATTVVVPLACWMSSLDWARAGSADKASRAPMGGKKQRRTAPLWCNAYARPGPGRAFSIRLARHGPVLEDVGGPRRWQLRSIY